MSKRIEAPFCEKCRAHARLTTGAEVYPRRKDLAKKLIWKCDGCGDRCGTHPGTKRPLGTLADEPLRRARELLHDRVLDPLWRGAPDCEAYQSGFAKDARAIKMIQNAARGRVYAWLADQLGIKREDCHTAMFSVETCRRAWRLLKSVDYPTVRLWCKLRGDREAA